MREQIEDALTGRDLALTARGSGDLEEALFLIGKAAEQLDKLWKRRGATIDMAGANASPEEQDLVEALAEVHGVKGGILRSAGESAKAALAYDRGLDFEQHPARKVDNSYNLVQSLFNRVLAAPHLIGETPWEVLSKDMWAELEKASDELDRQMTTRGQDPWARADVIMIQLLLAARNSSMGRRSIEDALEKLEKLNPEPDVYASTLRAVKDLERGLEQVDQDRRSESWKVVVDLLKVVIEKLEKGFEKAKEKAKAQ